MRFLCSETCGGPLSLVKHSHHLLWKMLRVILFEVHSSADFAFSSRIFEYFGPRRQLKTTFFVSVKTNHPDSFVHGQLDWVYFQPFFEATSHSLPQITMIKIEDRDDGDEGGEQGGDDVDIG